MRSALASLVVLASLAPAAARADSDGYYCAGRGYIAYEMSLSQAPGRHLLYVVRFSHAGAFTHLAPIPLGDFQVHGMKCDAGAVTLEAWDAGYLVDLSTPDHPTVTRRPAVSPRPPEPPNLGHWAKAGVVDLPDSAGATGEFQLVIAQAHHPVSGGVEHFTITEVVQRNPGPGTLRFVASLRLFEGVFLETAD